MPFLKTEVTPNLGGAPDTTDDMRGGMGLEGINNIGKFIDAGGLFVTITGNASIPIDLRLAEGVSILNAADLRVRGSVLNSTITDKRSPIAYGYGDKLALYFSQAPVLSVGAAGGFAGGRGGGGGRGGRGGSAPGRGADGALRPTGRGTANEQDTPQARPLSMNTPSTQMSAAQPGEDAAASDLNGGGGGRGGAQLPPEMRPRVVVRFAAENDLLVSGMLAGGAELANQAAVVDVPRGKGHVVMFANNPMWRNETQGSYFLLFNAMLNYDHLSAGVQTGAPGAGRGRRSGGGQ